MAIDAAAQYAVIEAQFLAAMARGATVVETSAFRVHLWPSSDPFYRNVAVPIRRPADWRPAIDEMRAAFAAVGRSPRLEFLEPRWPDLAAALDDAGLSPEMPQTVMVCTQRPRAAPDPAMQILASTDGSQAVAAAYLTAVQEAFEQPMDAAVLAREAARLADDIRTGDCVVAAIADDSGGFVSGASLIGVCTPCDAVGTVAELAGVWTAAAWRGRGLASRAVRALVDRLLRAGDGLVWLSAENARTAALYARQGFAPIGRQHTYVGIVSRRSGEPSASAA